MINNDENEQDDDSSGASGASDGAGDGQMKQAETTRPVSATADQRIADLRSRGGALCCVRAVQLLLRRLPHPFWRRHRASGRRQFGRRMAGTGLVGGFPGIDPQRLHHRRQRPLRLLRWLLPGMPPPLHLRRRLRRRPAGNVSDSHLATRACPVPRLPNRVTELRCRAASKSRIPAAIAALSDSVLSTIGIVTRPCASASASGPAPCASLPIRTAAGRVQSTAVYAVPSWAAASQIVHPRRQLLDLRPCRLHDRQAQQRPHAAPHHFGVVGVDCARPQQDAIDPGSGRCAQHRAQIAGIGDGVEDEQQAGVRWAAGAATSARRPARRAKRPYRSWPPARTSSTSSGLPARRPATAVVRVGLASLG